MWYFPHPRGVFAADHRSATPGRNATARSTRRFGENKFKIRALSVSRYWDRQTEKRDEIRPQLANRSSSVSEPADAGRIFAVRARRRALPPRSRGDQAGRRPGSMPRVVESTGRWRKSRGHRIHSGNSRTSLDRSETVNTRLSCRIIPRRLSSFNTLVTASR